MSRNMYIPQRRPVSKPKVLRPVHDTISLAEQYGSITRPRRLPRYRPGGNAVPAAGRRAMTSLLPRFQRSGNRKEWDHRPASLGEV